MLARVVRLGVLGVVLALLLTGCGHSKHKAAAWTLLSWLAGKQGMTQWTSLGLALPSRSDVKAIGGRTAFLKAAPYSHGWGFRNFSNTYTVMNNDLTAVLGGSKTVPQMLSDVAAALKG